ncbi:hypothetical protein QVD17_29708 [Tagetes erecta]|uniref:Uncharacterized protein n=1 Tax=Tagetes erecta TaxID=13708 RepID=A0AAD8NMM9_TARER|nr:hypothetical protein QVD17_29708 [Tagetes erecta]
MEEVGKTYSLSLEGGQMDICQASDSPFLKHWHCGVRASNSSPTFQNNVHARFPLLYIPLFSPCHLRAQSCWLSSRSIPKPLRPPYKGKTPTTFNHHHFPDFLVVKD